MYLDSKLSWNVEIPPESLHTDASMLQSAIATRLVANFAAKKATKDLGYYLAVTTVSNIKGGKVSQSSGNVLFRVDFNCITFKILPGEILHGIVQKVQKHGISIRCGPANLFLPHQKMDDYQYVPGENPYFINTKLSKIEKDAELRVLVIEERYVEAEEDFRVIVSLEGDYLGPISRKVVTFPSND